MRQSPKSACLEPLNARGDHHGNLKQFGSSRTVEQGQDRQAESVLQGERHLGMTRTSLDGRPDSRARALQSWHRQKTSRMRPRFTQGP